jgi:hypothetical protein
MQQGEAHAARRRTPVDRRYSFAYFSSMFRPTTARLALPERMTTCAPTGHIVPIQSPCRPLVRSLVPQGYLQVSRQMTDGTVQSPPTRRLPASDNKQGIFKWNLAVAPAGLLTGRAVCLDWRFCATDHDARPAPFQLGRTAYPATRDSEENLFKLFNLAT